MEFALLYLAIGERNQHGQDENADQSATSGSIDKHWYFNHAREEADNKGQTHCQEGIHYTQALDKHQLETIAALMEDIQWRQKVFPRHSGQWV